MDNLDNNNLEVRFSSKWFSIVILILSIIGISDTTYLTIKRYSHDNINCSIFEGCDFVTTSSYSAIFGVPVAILGIIFYIAVFVLSVLYLRSKNKIFLNFLLGLSTVGFLMSMWFIYTQAFVLSAFCLYCIVSAGISTTIFILSIIIMVQYNNKKYETNS